MQKQKKTKFGKAGGSKLTRTEVGRLVMEILKKEGISDIEAKASYIIKCIILQINLWV